MTMTRREALDDFLDNVSARSDTIARNRAERLLNRALDAIWQKHEWRDYQSPADFELTLVVDQRSYAMPSYFGRLGKGLVRNLSQSGRPIPPFDKDRLQARYPKAGTSGEVAGTPMFHYFGGIVGVYGQPTSSGEALEVVSSSASDDAVVCSIEGDDSNGAHQRNQVTLNGTTAVAIGTWSYVDDFGKGYPAGTDPTTELTTSEGTVTLRTVSAATALQQLLPQESTREHRVISFYPKPDTADTVAVPVMRRPSTRYQDGDPLPVDWWNAIHAFMVSNWQTIVGDKAVDAESPAFRSAVAELVMNDNRLASRITKQPFYDHV